MRALCSKTGKSGSSWLGEASPPPIFSQQIVLPRAVHLSQLLSLSILVTSRRAAYTAPTASFIPLTPGVWVCKCGCSSYLLSWHFSGRVGRFHNCSKKSQLLEIYPHLRPLSILPPFSERGTPFWHASVCQLQHTSAKDTTIFTSKYTKSLWQCPMHPQFCKILRHGIFMPH